MHALLIHGLPGSSHDLLPVAGRLAAAGHTPLAFDRPGWGPADPEPCGLAGNVAAALGHLDRAGAGRALVVGHSFGSLVALALAAHAPERVAALGLITPFGPGSVDTTDRAFSLRPAGGAVVGTYLTVAGAAQLTPLLNAWIARRYNFERDALRARGRWWLGSCARRAFVGEERVVVSEIDALLAIASSLPHPALVIAGSRDRITGCEPARALADILPNARLRVVEGEGHFVPLMRPALVASELVALAATVVMP